MLLFLVLIRLTGCMYINRNLFRQTGLQKGGKVNNCSMDYGRLVRRIFEETLTSSNPNQNSTTQWRIFSSNKSAPANREKRFYTNRYPNKHEVRFIFVWSGSEHIFKSEIENQKHIAVDIFFKDYPLSNGTTLLQIQSGRTVPLSFIIL